MPTFTVLVTANAFRESAPHSEQPIRRAGGEVLYPHRMGPVPAGELIPYLRRADAVVAATDPYVGAVLAECPRLRVIARWGTGYDSVDLEACTEHGVIACNAPRFNIEAVADHVVGMMLALARRLPHQDAIMRGGGWEEVRGVEVFGKTVGIVGFGAIGRAVARRAAGFNCPVLAYDPALDPKTVRSHGAEPAPLDRVFAEADFVTLHAALTADNRGLVSRELLFRMKPGAFFINAARGPLVDEEALVEALTAARIAGAAVDAFAQEPLPAAHPLRHLPNCLATPHSAFNTVEAAEATNAAVAQEVLSVLRGVCPRFALNPEVFDLPNLRAKVPLIG